MIPKTTTVQHAQASRSRGGKAACLSRPFSGAASVPLNSGFLPGWAGLEAQETLAAGL